MALSTFEKYKNALRSTGASASNGSFSNSDEEEKRRRMQEMYKSYSNDVSNNLSASGNISNPYQQYKNELNRVNENNMEREAKKQRAAILPELEKKLNPQRKSNNANVELPSFDIKNQNAEYSDLLSPYKNNGNAINDDLHKNLNRTYTPQKVEEKVDHTNNTLTPEEKLIYSQAKIETIDDDKAAEAVNQILKGKKQNQYYKNNYMNSADPLNNNPLRGFIHRNETGEKDIEEGKTILKEIGWSDDKIKEYSDYAEYLANDYGAKEANKNLQINPNATKGEKVLGGVVNTAYDLVQNPTRGIAGTLGIISSRDNALGSDVNNAYMRPMKTSEYATEQVINNAIGDDHFIGQKAYQYGLSTAESAEIALLSKGLGQNVSLVPFAAQAYASSYEDAKERGASEKQANMYGIASAMAEAGTEKVSLDHLWNMAGGTKVGKQLIIDWLAQAGIEASEEVASDFLNRYSDFLILGKDGKNAMTESIESYADQIRNERPNLSEDEIYKLAKENANNDFWRQVADDAIGGFVSGALMGGAGAFIGNVSSNIRNQEIANEYSSEAESIKGDTEYDLSNKAQAEEYAKNPIKAIAENIDDSTEQGKQNKSEVLSLADKYDKKGKLSASDNFKLNKILEQSEESNSSPEAKSSREKYFEYQKEMSQVPAEYRTAALGMTLDDATKKMQEAASKGDASEMGKVYNSMKNSTSAEVRNNADQTLESFVGMAENNGALQSDIESAKTSQQDAYVAGLRGESKENLGSITTLAEEAYNEGAKERILGNPSTVVKAENLKKDVRLSDGKNVNLYGFNSDGKIVTDNGDVVELDNLRDNSIYNAYHSAMQYDNSDTRNAFINGFKDDMNINAYSIAFGNFYNAGRTGLSFESQIENGARNSFYSKALGEDVVKTFFDAGRAELESDSRSDLNTESNKLFNFNTEGSFVDNRKVKNVKLNTDFMGKVANAFGIRLTLVDAKSRGAKERASYNPQTGEIVVTEDNVSSVFHELGHFAKQFAKEEYDKFSKSVLEAYSNAMEINLNGVKLSGADAYSYMVNDFTKSYKAHAKEKGLIVDNDAIIEELTNNALVGLLSSEEGMKSFTDTVAKNYTESEGKNIISKVKEFFNEILDSLRAWVNGSHMSIYERSQFNAKLDNQQQLIDEAMEVFNKAIIEHKYNEVTEQIGITIDAETESANPSEFSLTSWTESEYVQKREESIEALSKALNVSKKKAAKYIDDVNSIAKMIADDRVRLDYDADPNNNSVVSNAEYGASIDFSTICKKRLLYTGTLQAIQKQIGNRVITMQDYLDIRNAMLDDGLQTTCGCCYVEGSRIKLGQYMKEFIKRYSADNPKYIPNMYDLTMPDGIRKLRVNHPEVWEAREYFLNHMGQVEGHEGEKNLFGSQGKPKDYTERTDYRGELLNMFLNKPEKVKEKNLNGGLRIQSFSDFEIINLIDCMQVITDMSRCGLAGQAYTKVKEFADALGNTGLKINLSLMGKGVDANGDLILDEINGMTKEDALYLRNKYSENVGTIIVCFNDEQIKAAMKSDYIDFIIPFHRSQWRKSQYDALGLPEGTRDYTMHQNDRMIKDNGRLKKAERNYMPNEYWDYSKSGRWNAEKYIKMCNDNKLAPKFAFLLSKDENGKYYLPEGKEYDGYFKLLIDFKMYDNDGKGAPQKPVMPNFSMEECKKMLDDYTGGHESYPVAHDIADRFAEKIKAREKEFTVDSSNDQTKRYSIKVGMSDEDISNLFSTKNKHKKLAHMISNKKIEIIRNESDLRKFITDSYKNGKREIYAPYSKVDEDFRHQLLEASRGSFDAKGMYWMLYADDVFHSLDQHIDAKEDNDMPMSEEDLLYAITHIDDGTIIRIKNKDNLRRFDVAIYVNGGVVTLSDLYSHQRNGLTFKHGMKSTLEKFIKKYAKDYGDISGAYSILQRASTSEIENLKSYLPNLSPTNSITFEDTNSNSDNPNVRYSLEVDTNGNKLTDDQIKYFKDSKVVDENGELKVMYHGSRDAGITIFDPKYSDDHISLFFTDNQEVSNTYGSEQYKVYLNLVNPLIVEGYSGYWNRIPYGDVRDVTTNKTEVDGFLFNTAEEAKKFDDKYHLTEIKQVYAAAIENGEAEYDGVVYNKYDAEDLYLDAFEEAESEYRKYHKSNSVLKTFKDFFDNYQEYGWFDLYSVLKSYDRNAPSLSEIKEGYTYEEAVEGALQMFTNDAEENEESLESMLEEEVYILPHENENVVLADEKLTTRQIARKAFEDGYDGVIFKNISDTKNGQYVTSDVVIAFNSNQIKSIFNTAPTDDADIRYSLDAELDDFIDFITSDIQTGYESFSSILEDGKSALRRLKVDSNTVKSIATDIKTKYGSSIKLDTLSSMLERAFAYMTTQENVNYNDMMRIMNEISLPVLEQANTKVGEDVYRDIINNLKGYTIKLNPSQMKQVVSVYGSYANFKKAVRPLNVSLNGSTYLDSQWSEMVAATGYLLDADTTSSDQGLALADLIDSLRPTVVNNFSGSIDEVAKDLSMQIVEDFVKAQKDIDTTDIVEKLKNSRKAFEDNIRSKYNDRLSKAKEELKTRKERDNYIGFWKKILDKQEVRDAKAKAREDLREAKAKANEEAKEKLAEKRESDREKLDTYKDKIKEEYKEKQERYEYQTWYKNAIDYRDKVAEIKAKNQQRALDRKEREAKKYQKNQISKGMKKLTNWILKPTDEHHVPYELQNAISEFMAAMDFIEPDVTVDKDGKFIIEVFDHSEYVEGHRKMVKQTLTGSTRDEVLMKYYDLVHAGLGSNYVRAWYDRMSDVRDILAGATREDAKNSADMNNFLNNIDPTLADEFTDLLTRNKGVVDINNLGSEDLKIINRVVKGISHAINQQNRAYTQNANIDTWASDTIENAKSLKQKDHTAAFKKVQQNLMIDMATPDTFFEFQGKSGKDLYKSLMDAFNKKIKDIKASSEFMSDMVDKVFNGDKRAWKKAMKEWAGDKAKIYSFPVSEGKEIQMTGAQIMSLYELNKRQQAVLHYKGGIEVDTIKLNRGIERVQNRAVHLSNGDIAKILGVLTDQQKQVADSLQKFMATECARWGNEASLLMYDYEKFTEENYFPISTDRNTNATTNTNSVAAEMLNGIERMGITKQINPNADNPIVIKDIFDVFTNHVNDMAAYHSYAPAVKDILRWLNFKTREDMEGGGVTHITVKQAINTNMGRTDESGVEYIEKLLKDINGSEKSGEINTFWQGLIGNYKAAAVGANLRVIVQQPTAFMRAANVLDLSNMIKALPKAFISGSQMKRIKDISPLAWWKSQGYYEASMGKSLKEIVTGEGTVRDAIIEKSMWLAGKADDITWSILYNATESQVRSDAKKNKESLSQEEFRTRVDDLFDKMIAQTQVVDCTIMKSQWMRAKGSMAKLQTAFMAEPTKSYNMAMKEMVNDSREHGANVLLWKNTRKALVVLAVTDLLNSLAQSIIDAIRYRDDDEKYLDQVLDYLGSNMIDNINPLSRIPGLKDITDVLWSAIKGEEAYGQSFGQTMDYASVESIIDAFDTTSKLIQGTYNKTGFAAYMTYAKMMSHVTGIPLYNLSRDASAFWNLFSDQKLVKALPKKNDKYISTYNALDREKSDQDLQNAVKSAMEQGGTVKDLQSGIQNHYKSDYLDFLETNPEAAEELADKAKRGYLALGLSEEEAQTLIDAWDDPTYGYGDLDKAISSGEGIEEAIDHLKEGKDPDKIIEHLVNTYQSTIEFNDTYDVNSEIESNVNHAIKLVDNNLDYMKAAKQLADKAREKAEKAAAKAKKDEAKAKVYDIIDSGNGDYQQAITDWYNAGTDVSDMKSALTSDVVKVAVKQYKQGNQSAQQTLMRVATAKAFMDQQTGLKIPKKYGGNYYQYEIDQISEMMDKYDKEPW